MSGIEVVGLLLSAIPLFISAAEHYRDGLGFVKRAVRKELFLARYRDELVQQRTLLLLYLKAVVCKTNLSPSVQAILIDKPSGAAWQDPSVIKALKKELHEAYEPFITLLTTICTTFARQIRNDDGHGSSAAASEDDLLQRLQALCLKTTDDKDTDKDESFRAWSKIKFSWKHPERLAILEELKAHNVALEKLANAANRAKPYERKQQTRRVHATFELRDETERLYQVLCKACTCQSLEKRVIGLGLAVRHTDTCDDHASLSFEVAIVDEHNNACTVSVRMAKTADMDLQPSSRKRVRIGFAEPVKKKVDAFDQMRKLHDLCAEQQLAQKSNCCLQLVVDEKGNLYSTNKQESRERQQQQQQQQPTPPTVDPMLSLCDIMTDFKMYDRKRWLHREKAILAVILAYSLPQVHQSSWWQSLWDSENISFLSFGSSNMVTSNPDRQIKLRRPFARSVIAGGTQSLPPRQTAKPRPNAHLHALGVVLMELFLNQSITKTVAVDGGGLDRRSTAQDLLDEHADDINMTTEYLRAVRFCLSPHPNSRSGSFSFEDKGFREIFYDEVISMLEDDLSARFEVGDEIWAQVRK